MLHGRGRLALLVSLAALVAAPACGGLDLRKLEVVEVFSGWYDNGVKDGQTHVIPSISFRLRNGGSEPVTHLRMIVGFWFVDGREIDSAEVQVLEEQPLAPGATSEPILVRVSTGYTLPQPPAEIFMHSLFVDGMARLFAKRSGTIVPLGEYRLDRQILPNTGPAVPGAE